MPPKIRITREDIVRAALWIVRSSGHQALNARNIAAELNCSTQPIFSNFGSMDELRLAVIREGDALYRKYLQREMDEGKYPVYKAGGMAYIRFAREEKELFRLLFMRDRSREPEAQVEDPQMEAIVKHNTGLEDDKVKLFHLEMWAYVHGIAAMFATGYLDLEWELVSRMLTDAYQGMRKQYGMEA